jgi:outer membrane receptor protein involved in Fe transport
MADLGVINLPRSSFGLEEVVVTGVMDIVRDRRTPVAVSTISTAEIQAKGGNVEFPELMKSTPSIYVANQAGGYGDSEVFTRGFDQTNTAFLLNGQPINGMEDGKMYWSNWSGMTDIATAVQVQRGLGSSKLAISSVGGTTNIIMRATDLKQGGSASFLYGNDNYIKGTVAYNTGLMNDKFGVSFLLTHWQGDGWAEGTKGQGQNYFLSMGYKPNSRNSFNFLVTGAPQWHDQNFTKSISSYYNDPENPDEINLKFNNNFGELDGEYLSVRRNYYHKPVANLNWEFNINEKSDLSTVLYGSWGNGGGTGPYGNGSSYIDGGTTADGYINWDGVVDYNETVTDGIGNSRTYTGSAIRGSRNNHAWYGLVTKYGNALTENINVSIGADWRYYKGTHFRELVDLLGLNGFDESRHARYDNHIVSATYEAKPWKAITNSASEEERIDYANDETISYIGGFGQVEYNTGGFSAFLQGAVSNQSHVRFELYNELEADEESEKVSNVGYNLKTGASYSFDASNTVFFNTGYYQRQPFHDNIYLNYSNQVNPVTVPEKIFGIEAGYKYSNKGFAANLNGYYTSWKDRATTSDLDIGDELPNGDTMTVYGYQNKIQSQLHKGIELDFSYKVLSNLKIKGFASVGDWAFDGTLDRKYYNEDRDLLLETEGEDVDGVKVGGAAQTSFGLGVDFDVLEGLMLGLDYIYYDKLHSNLGVGANALELPAFGLLDFGARYNFGLNNGDLLTLRANVYNLLGTEYISRASTADEADVDDNNNWNGVNKSNRVMFGKTRTWNVSLKYSF